MEFSDMGRTIAFFGMILLLVGGGMMLFGKVPGIGKLPGDFFYQKDGFTLYAPIATSILISIILTIVINLFTRR